MRSNPARPDIPGIGERKAGALARSIEPTGTHADFATGGTRANSRAEAFGRAERHSRRVRRLKVALPLLAILLVAGFVGYSFLSTPPSVAIQTEGQAFAEGKLVMNSPKLEGFTKDGRPYSVNATRATQDFDKQDIINLDGIDAKMPVEADNWAKVEAVSGIYDRTANTLDVPTDILVTTTDGMVAKLKSAFLDINGGSLKSASTGRYPVAWVTDHRGFNGGARKRQAGCFRDARAGLHRPGSDEGRPGGQGEVNASN